MSTVIAILIFTSFSTLASLGLACWFGTLTPLIAAVSLLLGGVGGYFAYRDCHSLGLKEPKPGFWDKVILGFFLLFALRQFLWFYFYRDEDILTLNRYPYFDLHGHLAFIENFVNGTRFWPENPLFTGARFEYHFGMDLFNALFMKLGMPATHAFPLIGVLFALLTAATLFWWGRGFTVAAFLFSGGIAGYFFIGTLRLDDYQADLAWKSLPLTLLVPQRSFLFGFPAGLLLLWSWRRKLLENRAGLPAWIEAVFWGSMPIFHVHTFLFVTAIFFIWTFATRKIRSMAPLYWMALPAGFLLLSVMTGGFQKASMVWIRPGWMIENENPFVFFLVNFGFYVPLVFLTAIGVVIWGKKREWLMFFPAMLIFTALMFVMFGGWEWDNIKLIVWCYLLILPVIHEVLLRRMHYWSKIPLLILLFFSGFICVLSALSPKNTGVPIIKRSDMDEVCWVVKKLPSEARFATAQEGYHPVVLCGRKLVAGFPGSLKAAFGVNPEYVEKTLRRLMMGEFDWKDSAKNVHAEYLFWGPFERAAYKGSNRPWEMESLKIAQGSWGKIYDLNQPSPVVTGNLPTALLRGQGLKVRLYPNANWEGRPDWEATGMLPLFKWENLERPWQDPFSLMFEGEIYVEKSGPVVFYLTSDDGSALEINGAQVIDNLGEHGLRVRKKKLELKAGWHKIRLRYMDTGGGAALNLAWERKRGKLERIRPEFLRPEA